MSEREKQFGRLLTIATILFDKIEPNGGNKIHFKYGERFKKQPMDTFAKIHQEIMENTHTFDETHYLLLDVFQEILSEMEYEDFSNESLNGEYLLHSYKERHHWANAIMDTKEASEQWGLSQDHIKKLCREGKVRAKKIGSSWAIDRNQPNPKKYNVSE